MATASLIPTAPTPAQIANRQLAASGAAPTQSPSSAAAYSGSGLSTTSDYNDEAASELNDYLNGGTVTPAESSYEDTLLGQYNSNTAATESAYSNEYSGLQQDYQAQLDQLNRQIGNTTNTDDENNMGVNASVLAYDKNLGASEDAQLLGSEAQAEGANATAETGALNTLSENYNTNLTAGRSNMATQLESAATLQTPEEAATIAQTEAENAGVVQMQLEAPDAGITSSDSFAEAVQKFENSNYYQANIGQAQQTVKELTAQTQAAGASAAASAAQASASNATAAQTRALTGLMTGTGASQSVDYYAQQLAANAADPTQGMTLAQVQANVGQLGQAAAGVMEQIQQTASSQYGYNAAGAEIQDTGATNSENAQTGGSIYNMTGAAVGRTLPFVWNALSLSPSGSRSLTSTPSSSSGVTPNGITYTISP